VYLFLYHEVCYGTRRELSGHLVLFMGIFSIFACIGVKWFYSVAIVNGLQIRLNHIDYISCVHIRCIGSV
jgi:hypothetical protein